MCEYSNLTNGVCAINKEKCPYLYYCNKIQSYKELSSMPNSCRVKEEFNIPKGYYKVSYSRLNKLYIEVDGYIKIIDNPCDYTPLYVKLSKLKSGKYKIRQAWGEESDGRR